MANSGTADATERARVETHREGDALVLDISGSWRLGAPAPAPAEILRREAEGAPRIVIAGQSLRAWDSSLVLFVSQLRARAAAQGRTLELRDFPAAIGDLIAQSERAEENDRHAAARRGSGGDLHSWWERSLAEAHALFGFFGENVLGLGRILRRPHTFRFFDCIEQMRRCGIAALPIVGVISLLVGLTLGFVAAVQLREFGADIFVANLVGLAVFREMGPMMAAIVLTGRTGAAYAAELGNMKLGEEIDALETFGVRAHDFLVLPRLVALLFMMPLLALYADFIGVLGGLAVAEIMLGVSPAAFLAQLQEAVRMPDIASGLLKSFVFGMAVGYSGCYRGMHARRSSVGVGEATTAAVVMGILLIIVADAVFTVVFDVFGL